MTSLELIIRILGGLSDDLAKVKGDIDNIVFDIEALQKSLVRLEKDVTNDDKQC